VHPAFRSVAWPLAPRLTGPDNMHGRSALLALTPLVVVACSHASTQSAQVVQQGTHRDPELMISPMELKRDLYAFADDSFHGRETGTADAHRAAAYLARRAQQLGLEPAGDSLYLQRVPLVRQVFAAGTRITITPTGGRAQQLRLGADVAPVITLGGPPPEPARLAEGELTFIGYAPIDDSESVALARYDLEGKVLVALHGAPPHSKAGDVAKLESRQALGERLRRLMAVHPAGIVLLMTGGAEPIYDQLAPELLHNVVLDRPQAAVADSSPGLPAILFGVARRGSPLLPPGWPNDIARQALGRQLSIHLEVERQPFTGYNVAAVVRGSDPRLDMTYLAFGAHYDHLGIVHSRGPSHRGVKPDTIANGADDDASGSVALLAIARQMTYLRPRRSVLFVWHVAEEQGMLGSAYFTAHPTVPIDSIVTQFNADMIGRNDPNTLALVGPRAAPNYLSWRVGMIVDSVNRAASQPLHIDRRWDDPDDPDRIYERSDHISYANKGIPVIFFTTGPHEDYHRVSDEPQKIDYDKMARIAALMLESGLAVADRSSRPTSEAITQSISSRQP
jgi:peptidase M28-like protein